MKTVQVRAILTEDVSEPIVAQICEDFADWLEREGFEIQVKTGRASDDRGYDQLALSFVAAYR